MRWSSSSKNRIPSQKPTAAGKNASLPRSAACSIAGISKLHTDAATIPGQLNPHSGGEKPGGARGGAPHRVFLKQTPRSKT